VVIVNIGRDGFFLESEKYDKGYYDRVNKRFKCRPQNFPTAIDSTNPWKNYIPVKEDRDSKKELISMVDFSARIPNISQNILLILEVAFCSSISNAYFWKKIDNPDY
jgi:hypothetical protein